MKKILLLITVLIYLPIKVDGVEVAPRISDREIIERLSKLEEGQKQLRSEMNQRFEAIDQRFETLESQMNQRFDDTKWFLGIMIGTLLVINTGVLGYVLKRQGHIETSLETVKDEINFLKSVIEKLLPPKGAL